MKKGFIFVETMVVIAFLGTVLLTVYSSFTTVLDNAKARLYYDDPVYLYRTYYIMSFLEENNLTDYIKEKFGAGSSSTTNIISEFGCSGSQQILQAEHNSNERAFCTNMVNNWNISHIFIMPYIVDNVVLCTNKDEINLPANKSKSIACQRNRSLQSLSVQAVNYLYSLDGYTGTDTTNDDIRTYRIVVEFKIPYTQQVEYFEYFNLNNLDVCKSNPSSTTCISCKRNPGQAQCKNKTTITSYKYYYSTLEIPFGSNKQTAIETTDPTETPISGYKIVFNSNGGTAGSMAEMPMQHNETKNLPTSGFAKTNYTFMGWSTTADENGTYYRAGAAVTNLTNEPNGIVNLYAVWGRINDVTYFGNPTINQNVAHYTVNVDATIIGSRISSYGYSTNNGGSYEYSTSNSKTISFTQGYPSHNLKIAISTNNDSTTMIFSSTYNVTTRKVFVAQLYYGLLRRNGSVSEINNWVNTGYNESQLAWHVFNSPEYQNYCASNNSYEAIWERVKTRYRGFLGRNATDWEITGHANQVQIDIAAGRPGDALDVDSYLVRLAGSENEFRVICNNWGLTWSANYN